MAALQPRTTIRFGAAFNGIVTTYGSERAVAPLPHANPLANVRKEKPEKAEKRKENHRRYCQKIDKAKSEAASLVCAIHGIGVKEYDKPSKRRTTKRKPRPEVAH